MGRARDIGLSLGLWSVLASAGGCTHPTLLPAAENVVLLVDAPLPPNCTLVGRLVGESWNSFFFGDSLEPSATADLRNRAMGMGATHVVREWHDPSAHADFVEGTAYHCGAGPAQDANGTVRVNPNAPASVDPSAAVTINPDAAVTVDPNAAVTINPDANNATGGETKPTGPATPSDVSVPGVPAQGPR